jgi:hypothetical protein
MKTCRQDRVWLLSIRLKSLSRYSDKRKYTQCVCTDVSANRANSKQLPNGFQNLRAEGAEASLSPLSSDGFEVSALLLTVDIIAACATLLSCESLEVLIGSRSRWPQSLQMA